MSGKTHKKGKGLKGDVLKLVRSIEWAFE